MSLKPFIIKTITLKWTSNSILKLFSARKRCGTTFTDRSNEQNTHQKQKTHKRLVKCVLFTYRRQLGAMPAFLALYPYVWNFRHFDIFGHSESITVWSNWFFLIVNLFSVNNFTFRRFFTCQESTPQ